jgi:hypothetical protein
VWSFDRMLRFGVSAGRGGGTWGS